MGKSDLMLEINIPAPGLRPGAGFLHAYMESLYKEIESCAADLSDYNIRTVYIRGAGGPPDLDLRVFTRTLRQKLDIKDAEKVIEIEPNRISTADFSTYQNFRTDLYRINLASLNYSDFMRLKLHYEYNHYTWIRKLLSYSKMTNVCIELLAGIERQSEASMTDSLNRVMSFDPDKVCFIPVYDNGDTAATAGLLETARLYLSERGYHRTSVYEYAKEGMDSVHTRLQNTDCEYWGLGVGAVSFLDGCLMTNTSNPDTYISAQGDIEKMVEKAVRLDGKSLAKNWLLRGLNAADGISLEEAAGTCGTYKEKEPCSAEDGQEAFLKNCLDRLCAEGLAMQDGLRFSLTMQGAADMKSVRRIISGGGPA